MGIFAELHIEQPVLIILDLTDDGIDRYHCDRKLIRYFRVNSIMIIAVRSLTASRKAV